MSNPKCLMCRGTGRIVDDYGRDEGACGCETPQRDPNAPSGAGWLEEIMRGSMSAMEEAQRKTDEHRATCNVRPCTRCQRFMCPCGKPFDGGHRKRCDECIAGHRRAEALRGPFDSVPKRFQWALDASPADVAKRVKLAAPILNRQLSAPPPGDMLLVGDTAAGKTSLVVAMFGAWLRQDPDSRRGARFVESFWLAGCRARHPLGQGDPPEYVQATTAPLLVLDDLGSETDDRRGVLTEVIFKRHNNELPTWLTSGFDPTQLMARYGSQVMRRPIEHGLMLRLGAK